MKAQTHGLIVAAATILLATRGFALAEGVSDCNKALILDTYQSFDSQHVDWRLADHVDQGTWNTITHNGSVTVPIYGVPSGGSYSDFHNSVEKNIHDHSESLTLDQAHNVMWTGLGANGGEAYRDCLRTIEATGSGLHVAVKYATADQISLILQWAPVGSESNPVTPSYKGITRDESGNPLPSALAAGSTSIILKRPATERIFVVNVPGHSDQVVLEPLPPPPPPLHSPIPFSYHMTGGTQHAPFPGNGGNCNCGSSGVAFYTAPTGLQSVTDILAQAGQPFSFRWDSASICRGLTIEHYPTNMGTVDFGQGTKAVPPEIDGVVTATYPDPGSYPVTFDFRVKCLNLHCSNVCASHGTVTVNVGG